MEDVVVAIITTVLVVALIPLFLWKRRQVPQSHAEQAQKETVARATDSRWLRRRPSTSSSQRVEGTDGAAAEANKSKKKGKEKRQARQEEPKTPLASQRSKDEFWVMNLSTLGL